MTSRGIFLVVVIIGLLIVAPILWFMNSRHNAVKKAEQAVVDSMPENLLTAAVAAGNAGNFDLAMTKINAAIKQQPDNLNLLSMRIRIEIKQADDQNVKAQEHYRTAGARIDVATAIIEDALKNGTVDKWDVLPLYQVILISKARVFDKCGNPQQAQIARQNAQVVANMIEQERLRQVAAVNAKLAQEQAEKQKKKINPKK